MSEQQLIEELRHQRDAAYAQRDVLVQVVRALLKRCRPNDFSDADEQQDVRWAKAVLAEVGR